MPAWRIICGNKLGFVRIIKNTRYAYCKSATKSIKAANAGLDLQGSVVASDAFFPFRDGLDVVVDAGATAVIQPGGSMRDQEVIDAANERDVCMVFMGVRHFRH